MPKEKSDKKVVKLRHEPLNRQIEKKNGKLKVPKSGKSKKDIDDIEELEDDDAAEKQYHANNSKGNKLKSYDDDGENNEWPENNINEEDQDDDDDNEDFDIQEDDDQDGNDQEDIVELDGENFAASGLSESEEAVVQKFLKANKSETRTLADIIMEKIRQNSETNIDDNNEDNNGALQSSSSSSSQAIPPKVSEVYVSVGKILHHYKSGKLPKALKMLPHLKNWEEILWLTRPDEWSPCAVYACTRIFISNLNVKLVQRFLNLILLEKCRDDIQENRSLNYHLYMALKKALFKPAAFYKGVLLPLVQSYTCTLREATIFSSVLMKVSIPGNHSAAVLLRLAEMPYNGSNSMFIKTLILKKYALPRRVIIALVNHFISFEKDTRLLPVIWHQSLLAFAQRYKNELDDKQKTQLKALFKIHSHHMITPEIRRELFSHSHNHDSTTTTAGASAGGAGKQRATVGVGSVHRNDDMVAEEY